MCVCVCAPVHTHTPFSWECSYPPTYPVARNAPGQGQPLRAGRLRRQLGQRERDLTQERLLAEPVGVRHVHADFKARPLQTQRLIPCPAIKGHNHHWQTQWVDGRSARRPGQCDADTLGEGKLEVKYIVAL